MFLSEAEVPPFPIEENSKTKDEIRLKYRYLDLRRPDLQKNIMLEEQSNACLQDSSLQMKDSWRLKLLCLERVHRKVQEITWYRPVYIQGHFYGLPQSPQLYKQLLMCSGYDRYIQIARCFRDEDLRADRQPEFTQIDMELSFVDVDDVIDVNERFLAYLLKKFLDIDVKLPIQRITWQEAMDRFGSDKPDMRFGMELHDVSDVVKTVDFVFTGALENGGSVRGINAEGQGVCLVRKSTNSLSLPKVTVQKVLHTLQSHEDGTENLLCQIHDR